MREERTRCEIDLRLHLRCVISCVLPPQPHVQLCAYVYSFLHQVLCSLGCDESMQEDFRLCHETALCMRREEACENCGMVVMQKDLADHKVNDCPGFLRACPTGCGVKVRMMVISGKSKERFRNVGSDGVVSILYFSSMVSFSIGNP